VTSSPYVPSSEGQNQFDEPVTTWEPAGTTEAGTDIYAPTTGQSSTSSTASTAKDTAKDEAAGLKDTAVDRGQHVAGVAKEQAGAVKDTALEQGQHVADVAKEQVTEVAAEASAHAKDLLSEGLTEIRGQLGSQQKRLAQGVHSLADELGTMASKSDKSGPLTDYAKQLSHRGGELSHWLENAEPSEVLDTVRDFARRRPAAFLGAAALAGVVVGRLTRSLAANAKDEKQPAALDSSYTGTTGYATGPAYTTGTEYATGTEYSAAPQQYGVETTTTSPYSQDVAGSGYTSGQTFTDDPTYTTDQTYTTNEDYAVGETSRPYGTTGSDGVTR